MEKVTLTKVSVTDKKKDGTRCVTKTGQPFYKVGIQTKEYGSDYINGLVFEEVNWKEGDVVELEISEEEYNGFTSKKFSLPRKEGGNNDSGLKKAVATLQAQMKSVIEQVRKNKENIEKRPEVNFDPKREEEEVKRGWGLGDESDTQDDSGIDPEEIDF